ncbi:unnamed protein product [Sphagnum balticum]
MEDSIMEASFTTVKMTLNKFCFDEILKERIDEYVFNANRIMFEAYALANLHIIRLLAINKPIPKLDQSFFYNCCVFVSEMYERKAQKPDSSEMIETFHIYCAQRPEGYKPPFRDYTCNMINYICKAMAVATMNHLVLNFSKRFTNYLKRRHNLNQNQACEVANDVYKDSYEGNDEHVLDYRKKLDDKPPYEKYIENDPTHILRLYSEICDDCNRSFSLLPHKSSFTMSYVTIDRSVLIDLLNSFKKWGDNKSTAIQEINKMRTKDLETAFRDDPLKYWKMFFDIDKVKDFAGIIHTDGKAVSVMCRCSRLPKEKVSITRRKKKKARIDAYDNDDYDVIRGIDPGFRNMFVASTVKSKDTVGSEDTAGSKEILKCSSKEYYHRCRMTFAAKQKQRYYDDNAMFTQKIKAVPSNKVKNENGYLVFLKYALEHVVEFFGASPR